MMDELLAENRDDLFPAGPGSEEALFGSEPGPFPQLYLQDKNTRTWHPSSSDQRSSRIGDNGSLSVAEISDEMGVVLMQLKKTDSMSVAQL